MVKRFILPAAILIAILLIGTIGYSLIGGSGYSLLDAIYMTVITIATIGYSEVIDLSNNPGGRVFTMLIAFTGIGVLAYIMSSLTAFIVEGELSRAFRRRRMENLAQTLKDHYIVCGIGLVGSNIVKELQITKRPYIVIDIAPEKADRNNARQFEVVIEGDATDSDILNKASVGGAKGLFAVTSDDNMNLVICLTARHLNPRLRIVSQCNELKNSDKLKHAGADAVVSPGYIGGLRMASEMVRPKVVTFLDTMLRDSKGSVRVEEVEVPVSMAGVSLKALDLKRHRDALLLAIIGSCGWIYNPDEEYRLEAGNTLIFMTSVTDRIELTRVFQATLS